MTWRPNGCSARSGESRRSIAGAGRRAPRLCRVRPRRDPAIVSRRSEPAHRRRRETGGGRRPGRGRGRARDRAGRRPTAEQFQALFEPKGVVVAGASTHPGKFGFVSLHNLLAAGYKGKVVRARTSKAPTCSASTPCADDRRPPRRAEADLVFVCTPAARQPRAAAGVRSEGRPRRVRHDRPATARRATTGDEAEARARGAGRRARHPARRPERPGRRLDAGEAVRADRRAVPAAGPHRHRQPVGQLRVVVPELRDADRRRRQPRGERRQRGRGTVADYLDFYADDPETAVGLAYVEGVADGRAFFERVRAVAARKPLVLVKGGATAGGQRAAASHTGCARHRRPCVRRACRQAGVTRAATSRRRSRPRRRSPPSRCRRARGPSWSRPPAGGASSPPTRSPRSDLELLPLPDDLRDAIDEHAAAALEPQQPDRPGRRRDPRHDPDGAGARSPRIPRSTRSIYLGDRASSRTRRG